MGRSGAKVVEVNAQSLPWYLIGVLVSALVAVFHALLRGKILSSKVSDLLRESSEKRAEVAEAGVAANTRSVESLVASVAKLLVLAENQDKVLKAWGERNRDHPQGRGGAS